MRCRSTLRHNATLCSQHGYATSNAAIDRIPYVDLDRTHSNRLNLSSTAQLCIGILYCFGCLLKGSHSPAQGSTSLALLWEALWRCTPRHLTVRITSLGSRLSRELRYHPSCQHASE